MKKFFLLIVVSTMMILQAYAGGLVSNTNQSASYYRMLARGASTSGDAVYFNPAGLAFLENGLTVSLNTQMIWMERTLNNDFPGLKKFMDPSNPSAPPRTGEFVGNLFVPVFPGVYVAYKKNNVTLSLGFNPPAGGGSIEFDKGIPMLEAPISAIKLAMPLITDYRMDAMMKGSSIVYGVQVGASYRINEMLGFSAGVRMMFASNSYEGYLRDIKINPQHPQLNPNNTMIPATNFFAAMGNGLAAQAEQAALAGDAATAAFLTEKATEMMINSAKTSDKELNASQKGSGIAPIVGLHFSTGKLNLAAKYEFKTTITLTNEPTKDDLNMYPKTEKPRSDVPALLSLAGSYDIVPALRFSFTYIHHFEKQAEIETWESEPTPANPLNGKIEKRQNFIDCGTNEYMAGLEWKLNDKLIISAGCQYSDVSVKDDWQNDITHHLDNFTLGLGAAYHFSDRLTLNIGGLNTWYNTVSKDEKKPIPYTQTYDRTNKAIALGIDFRF